MAERELPSNSHALKERPVEEAEKRAPVAKGHARKKSAIMSNIVAEEADNVKSYVISDLVVPFIKDMILSTVEMFLYGEVRGGKRSGSSYGSRDKRYDYSRLSRRYDRDDDRPTRDRNLRVVEAMVPNRKAVMDVIDEMLDIQREYEQVTVRDFYESCDMPTETTDRKWGWTDLRERDIDYRPYRGEYLISMPRPIAL